MTGIFGLLGPPRTAEELVDMRATIVKNFSIEKFTCDDCVACPTCEWAFDPYNTDGDCLAEK